MKSMPNASVVLDAMSIDADELATLTTEHSTDEQIKDMIERLPLNLSAETKLIIYNVLQFSVQVGNEVVRLGKKVVEMALMLSNRYPNATFGLIIAAILTALIAMLPIIGPALAALLGPLLAILGVAGGFLKDLREKNPNLSADVDKAANTFSALKQA
jgi:hypothetical protein